MSVLPSLIATSGALTISTSSSLTIVSSSSL